MIVVRRDTTSLIPCLNLHGAPLHGRAWYGLIADEHHIDAAYVIAAFGIGCRAGLQETHFTDKFWIAVAEDGFAYPMEYVERA